MNTRKIFRLMMIPAMAGLILSLSFCKKETTTETVYDSGKAISGLVKYPDYNNAMVIAKGAVVYLYSGTSATGTLVGTTFADASGKYTFSHLAAGSYFLTSKYNTENSNFKNINGINFVTNPGYGVSLADVDLTKDIDLVSYVSAPTSLNISLDSTQNGYRQVTWEIHSKMDFNLFNSLTFENVDTDKFRCLRIAYDVIKEDSSSAVVMNAANEIAVDLFLNGRIDFLSIPDLIEIELERHTPSSDTDLENIINIDKDTRIYLREKYSI